MNRTYITNIRHFLDESGEIAEIMPKSGRMIASYFASLIDTATKAFPTRSFNSSVRCRTPRCREEIVLTLTDPKKDIHWYCPGCHDEGYISNWQGTKWDNLD